MGIKCCKDCPDRYVGCHGSCEKYKKERAELDRLKERMKNDEEFNKYHQEQIGKRITQYVKRNKYRRFERHD